jgi:FG-GAP-like repeat
MMKRDDSRVAPSRPKRRPALGVVAVSLVPILASTLAASHFLALPAKASGSLSFAAAVNYPVAGPPNAVALGDLNGDGHSDLIATNGTNLLGVLLGDGKGGFLNGGVDSIIGTDPDAVAIGDLDGDGNPDGVIANCGSNDVTVLLGSFNGGVRYPAGISLTRWQSVTSTETASLTWSSQTKAAMT